MGRGRRRREMRSTSPRAVPYRIVLRDRELHLAALSQALLGSFHPQQTPDERDAARDLLPLLLRLVAYDLLQVAIERTEGVDPLAYMSAYGALTGHTDRNLSRLTAHEPGDILRRALRSYRGFLQVCIDASKDAARRLGRTSRLERATQLLVAGAPYLSANPEQWPATREAIAHLIEITGALLEESGRPLGGDRKPPV